MDEALNWLVKIFKGGVPVATCRQWVGDLSLFISVDRLIRLNRYRDRYRDTPYSI